MKPNLSELVTIIHYCLQQNLIINGKSMVTAIISNHIANRMDKLHMENLHHMEISDVRILATTLLRILSNSKRGAKSSTNEPFLIQGKHIFVSLGKRGVLWCCPSRLVSMEDKALLDQLVPQNVVISGDEIPLMTAHIPVEVIQANEIHHSANGAGDAFCAGLLYGILHSTKLLNKVSNHFTPAINQKNYPNLSNIKMGLQNARNWIKRK